MLGVIGGLTVMLGSSPLAAQGSSSRSFDPATVAPGGTVTVTITVADYGVTGRVRETLPDGFEYVSTTNPLGLSAADSNLGQGILTFNLFGASSFSYQVTASSIENTYAFSGVVIDSAQAESAVGGDTDVVVRAAATATATPVATEEPEES